MNYLTFFRVKISIKKSPPELPTCRFVKTKCILTVSASCKIRRYLVTEKNVYLREELEHLLLVKSVWNVAQIDDAATLQMQNSQAKIKCKCM
jgi:hypothetical protein